MKIKSLGIGVALAGAMVLAAGTAQADGMNSKYAPPAPIWSGLYVGADVGFAYADVETSIFGYHVPWLSGETSNELTFGLLVGYNVQRGNTVMGIEADVNFTDVGSADATLSSLRGRYGIVNNGWLIYGTAGLGILSGDFDTTTGIVVGAGVETKLRPNMTVGFEGLYYNLPEQSWGPVDIDVDFVSFRGRMTYQLDRGVDALK